MIKLGDFTQRVVDKAKVSQASATSQLDFVKKNMDEKNKESFGAELGQLVKLQGQLTARVIKAEKVLGRFRDSAEKKQTAEAENFRSACMKIIRHNMKEKELNMDQIFEEFDKKGQ